MNFQLERRARLALIALFSVFFAAALFYLVKTLARPGLVEENTPQYSYNQQAQVNYRVYLKPNNLYPDNNLDPGKVYITNFVDYINTFFTYRFSGERAAGIKGTYDVVAVVEATAGKDGKKVWEREFALLPKTPFAGQDRVIAVQQELPVRFGDLNAFVAGVVKESELIPDEVKMTVRWNVTVEAVTDSGTVQEKIAPTLVIPMAQKAFDIGGENNKEKAGSLILTRQTPAKANMKAVSGYGAATGLSVIVLALLMLFTTGSSGETDPVQKSLKRILKKHGDRLAVIGGDLSPAFENVIAVKSMDDLVRIADELSKPVMYRPYSGGGELPSFYVFDEPKVFVFELRTGTV